MPRKIVICLNENEHRALCIDAQNDLRPIKLHAKYLIHIELVRRGLLSQENLITKEDLPIDDKQNVNYGSCVDPATPGDFSNPVGDRSATQK